MYTLWIYEVDESTAVPYPLAKLDKQIIRQECERWAMKRPARYRTYPVKVDWAVSENGGDVLSGHCDIQE